MAAGAKSSAMILFNVVSILIVTTQYIFCQKRHLMSPNNISERAEKNQLQIVQMTSVAKIKIQPRILIMQHKKSNDSVISLILEI